MAVKISVMTIAYNSERYIGECIKSVLRQSFADFEYIIVDDASTDNTWNIIQWYASRDGRITAFRNKKNLMIPKSRNVALSKASKKSEYLAIIDSDDTWSEDKLEIQARYLDENQDTAIVGSDMNLINELSVRIGERNYPSSSIEIRRGMLSKNCFAQSAVMIRKKDLGSLRYDEKYLRCQDYDLWFKILRDKEGFNIDSCLVHYRVSGEQGKRTALKDTLRYTIQIQRKWLFSKEFRNLKGLAYFVIENILLFVPNNIILKLFEAKEYKK